MKIKSRDESIKFLMNKAVVLSGISIKGEVYDDLTKLVYEVDGYDEETNKIIIKNRHWSKEVGINELYVLGKSSLKVYDFKLTNRLIDIITNTEDTFFTMVDLSKEELDSLKGRYWVNYGELFVENKSHATLHNLQRVETTMSDLVRGYINIRHNYFMNP